MKRALLSALALSLTVAAAHGQMVRTPSIPDDSKSVEIDKGSFRISQRAQFIGSEVFSFKTSGDSMLVTSRTFQVLPGNDTLSKSVVQVVGANDFGLRNYLSKQTQGGHTMTRGLVLSDTTFTSYRQVDNAGEGDVLSLPPGRFYVVDPKVFICFDLMCRSLQGKVFDHRPLSLIVLGERDTVLEIRAEDLGTETVRWGAQPVQARKLRLSDENTSFLAWASPRGNLLRLEQPESGLRVEREPPAIKPPAKRPPHPHP